MDDATAYAKLADEVTRAAKATASKWPGVIDAEDLEQSLWVRLFEARQTLYELADSDQGVRTTVLNRAAEQIAATERDDYDRFTGNFYYSTEEVTDLLERGILVAEDGVQSSWSDPEEIRYGSIDTDRAQAKADVKIGMYRLKERNSSYWAALINRYQLSQGVNNDSSTERSELLRARRALTDEMNGNRREVVNAHRENGGPGARMPKRRLMFEEDVRREVNHGLD